MQYINLIPTHDILIFDQNTPDGAEAAAGEGLLETVPTSGQSARLKSTDRAHNAMRTEGGTSVNVTDVEFGEVENLPDPTPGVVYIVSLLTALGAQHRSDLVFPHDQIRNEKGAVIGARSFGRVAAPSQLP